MTRPTTDHLARTLGAVIRLAGTQATEPDYYLLAHLADLLAWLQAETALQAEAAAHGRGALIGTIGGQGHASTVEARLSWPALRDIDDPAIRAEMMTRYGGQNDDLLRELAKLRRDWRPQLAALTGSFERDMNAVAERAAKRDDDAYTEA